jgi:rfaE bifunctional protein kinase chain/domain/rfaE bifunctional protein nucleotidyltransferase chain/domain
MTLPAHGAPAKILSHDELLARRAAARAAGRKVVHCHGCFDIVHPGHIRHLRYARQMGDLLLVTITGDAEIKKGTGRPLIPEELRAESLAALDCVDWVYVEPRPTAAELLSEVRPDVYVKGREYEFNSDPRFQAERRAVEAGGGRVVFSSGDIVFSSTALIAALEQSVDPFQARLAQLLEHPELQGPNLFNQISSFRSRRILVVGETILDTYVLCDRPEVAGESPVMTLRPIERRHYDGGAAIIALHLAALGARPTLVTPMPGDAQGVAVSHRLLAAGVDVRPFHVARPLTEKQRFLVGAQKVMKLDLLEPLVLDASQQDQFIALVEDAARGVQGAIVADFGQGLFTPAVVARTCTACRKSAQVLSGDVSSRRSNLRAMHSMDLLCPSETELREAFGAFDRGLPTITWELLEETRSRHAIVTMGPEGLIAFDRLPGADSLAEGSFASRLRAQHVPALAPFAIDPLGCGDSLIAAATLAIAGGASLLGSAFLGSAAAAIQAQRLGNIPISATDLRQSIVRIQSAHMAFAPAEVVNSRSAAALRAS